MKVLYICPGKYKKSDGILTKATRTTKFWTAQGIESKILTYNEVILSQFDKILLKVPSSFFQSIVFYMAFTRLVNKTITDLNPDIIYTRHFVFPFFFKKSGKVVLEVNGNILKETRDAPKKTQFLIKKSIQHYNKYAAAIVNVGRNLDDGFEVKKKINLPNAILASSSEVLDSFKSKSLAKCSGEKPLQIVFMATKNRPYYAVDFILEFFERANLNARLQIIGEIKTSKKTSNKITFVGPKEGEQLDSLLRQSDLAIGLIDFHKGAKASPLKTRTYFEYGLPVFCTDNDCDFDNTFPFYYSLPPSQKPDADEYAKKLTDFVEILKNLEPNSIAELPENVKKSCIDFREPFRIDMFQSILGK